MHNALRSPFAATLVALLFTACGGPATPDNGTPATDASATPGADRDIHGCIPSAGETWSELRQACVRLFDDGQRLEPATPVEGEAVLSAFVILSADSAHAELFMPGGEGAVLLERTADGVYGAEDLRYEMSSQALFSGADRIYGAAH